MISCVRLTTLLAAAASLASCQLGVDVVVARAGDGVVIDTYKYGTKTPACVENVDVHLDATSQHLDDQPSWRVSSYGSCASHFVYGQAPANFSQASVAPRLLLAKRYVVSVSGRGYNGAEAFTLDDHGGITSE